MNLTCKNKIVFLPPRYNMTTYSYELINNGHEKLSAYFTEEEIKESLSVGTVHFNGNKPWQQYCLNFDIWWEYYRKSPIFDEKFYFDFYYNRLNIFDQLSLMKRVKILVRYFVFGKRKI